MPKVSTFTTDQFVELRLIERARMKQGQPGLRDEFQSFIKSLSGVGKVPADETPALTDLPCTNSGVFVDPCFLSPTSQENALVGGEDAMAKPAYFTATPDTGVPKRHKATLAKYRKLATEHGFPSKRPVCYRVKAGFTLKQHAAKAGPCHKSFQYLQDWDFPDEATPDCLVFWVPHILKGSTYKTKDQQLKLLADLRGKLELSAHHMSGFGNVALVAGLILAYFKATGERIPLNNEWVRTDTCRAGGYRLGLGDFDGAGLRCGSVDWDGVRRGGLGVFALGVELGS